MLLMLIIILVSAFVAYQHLTAMRLIKAHGFKVPTKLIGRTEIWRLKPHSDAIHLFQICGVYVYSKWHYHSTTLID